MKFYKKPVEVDAFRWTGNHDQVEDPEWIVEALQNGWANIRQNYDDDALELRIHGPFGSTEIAHPGDWVVQEPTGEIYPLSERDFGRMFERADA